VAVNPPAFQPAPGQLRRLTRTQFRNALRDVFKVETNMNDLASDSWDGNFAVIGASVVVISDLGVEQYSTAVENAVMTAMADSAKTTAFLGCTPTGKSNDTCVRGYLQNLGLRAWRRPLETAELDRLVAIATKASTDLGNVIEGARWSTVALFTSPNFLYRPELGATANNVRKLTGNEMASRLAFLLWNSIPDKTLMAQATGGMLATADGIRTAATRLLDAPAGREAAGAFAEEYMRLDRIATQAKDPAMYPEYTASLQTAMARDARGTWETVAFDDKANILSVFSTPKVVVNSDLAKLYGLDATGLTATTFQVRSLPADGPRIGVLSKAAFSSAFANQKEGSPTLRGKFIRETFMCQPVSSPPNDVDTMLVEIPNMPMTKRQRLELHRTEQRCKVCHGLMDPMGLPLENFDAIGRYRTTDHNIQIDPSGNIDGKDIANAREMGIVAASSMNIARCFLRRYYTYATGHEERPEDGTALNTLATAFEAGGFKLRELILSTVSHDAFSLVAPQL